MASAAELITIDIEQAVAALAGGGLVAIPTETVYGLAALADRREAVRRIFEVKGRPADHPLIVHLGGVDALDGWVARIPDAARVLAATCWPGHVLVESNDDLYVLDLTTDRRSRRPAPRRSGSTSS